MRNLCVILFFGSVLVAGELPKGTTTVPPSTQREGDAKTGFDYLTTGDYVGSGIPFDTFVSVFGNQPPNHLSRKGTNRFVPFDYNAVRAKNGVTVVSANCLQCHAQQVNGKLVMGLGRITQDFTRERGAAVPGVDLMLAFTHGLTSKEYAAYLPFRRAVTATSKHLKTEVVGANPADKLAIVLAAHRDPKTLKWREEPGLVIPEEVIPTDVPAWWLLKKKHAMFYTGNGRGDFARIMMASSLLTLQDSREAAEVDTKFADVLAYIESLEPPNYPWPVDPELVRRGEQVFTKNCADCHGTYAAKPGEEETYPNLMVELARVRTDPLLAQSHVAHKAFFDWYNNSWFATTEPKANMVPTPGYVAPPLDGIWLTAPYLHNGSVPTLAGLLNSETRPDRWRRDARKNLRQDYDRERIGWRVESDPPAEENRARSNRIYDSSKPGYGNRGHTFGDKLNDTDRKALLAYLKTL